MNGYGAPPQAYTRDTLVKAIDWIAEQPEHLRAQAANADALVSLYLQFKRRTKGMTTFPVSGEAFTQDLKSLAKDLEQFSAPPVQATSPPNNPPQRNSSSFQDQVQNSQMPPQQHPLSATASTPQKNQQPPIEQPLNAAQWVVDPKSWAQASSLQRRLNLSSEGEALRMMIALGSEQLGKLLP